MIYPSCVFRDLKMENIMLDTKKTSIKLIGEYSVSWISVCESVVWALEDENSESNAMLMQIYSGSMSKINVGPPSTTLAQHWS